MNKWMPKNALIRAMTLSIVQTIEWIGVDFNSKDKYNFNILNYEPRTTL